jgi:hypothetical protein
VHSLRPRDGGSAGWQPEYSFSYAYGPGGFAPARLAKLAGQIQDNQDTSGARGKYLSFYRAKKTAFPRGQADYPSNWKLAICATSIPDAQNFEACVSRMN